MNYIKGTVALILLGTSICIAIYGMAEAVFFMKIAMKWIHNFAGSFSRKPVYWTINVIGFILIFSATASAFIGCMAFVKYVFVKIDDKILSRFSQ